MMMHAPVALHHWWNNLLPDYGFFINAFKCFLLLKDGSVVDSTCFQGTGVNVCYDGHTCRYLGSAIGTDNFVESDQFQTWCGKLSLLIDVASHAAFSSYIHLDFSCVVLPLPSLSAG